MRERTGVRLSTEIELTIRLSATRENGSVQVQGTLAPSGDGETVTFSGWLDLLDRLEQIIDRSTDSDGDEGG